MQNQQISPMERIFFSNFNVQQNTIFTNIINVNNLNDDFNSMLDEQRLNYDSSYQDNQFETSNQQEPQMIQENVIVSQEQQYRLQKSQNQSKNEQANLDLILEIENKLIIQKQETNQEEYDESLQESQYQASAYKNQKKKKQ